MAQYIKLDDENKRKEQLDLIQKMQQRIKILQTSVLILAIDCILLTYMTLK